MPTQYNPDHPLCSVPGCQRQAQRTRRCARHLRQLGPDTSPHVRKRRSPLGCFWAKVDKNGPAWSGTPCWLWLGAKNHGGYGQAKKPSGRRGGFTVSAHRLAYELFVGAIPAKLEIDHLCRNRACVNPAHLEAVTHRVNDLRGISFSAVNAKKTHCNNGHEFTPENTRLEGQGRRCLACRRARNQRAWQRELQRRG